VPRRQTAEVRLGDMVGACVELQNSAAPAHEGSHGGARKTRCRHDAAACHARTNRAGGLQRAQSEGRDRGLVAALRSAPADRRSDLTNRAPRYNHPFKFYLVHEAQPNAFATPGGNVYVVDSLLYFVTNTEQLAGTLCHEVSHTIHHDSMNLIEKEREIHRREIGAVVLLGPTRARERRLVSC
jgi:peptidase M48-like protein